MSRLVMALMGFAYSAALWLFMGGEIDPLSALLLVALSVPIHELLHVAAARLLDLDLQPLVDGGFVGFRVKGYVSRSRYLTVLVAPQLLTASAALLWLSTGRPELLAMALTNVAISCRDLAVLGRVLYPSLRAINLSTSAASSS